MTPLLQITNLHAKVAGTETEILRGLNLTVHAGEIHAIMGPNGSGKSTLSKVIAGHPSFEVTAGEVLYKGENLLEKEPQERAQAGIFLAFQYPLEVPGVSNRDFLRMSYNARQRYLTLPELEPKDFNTLLQTKLPVVEMKEEYIDRAINEGFSGGEKKRNEILQMAVLNPELALLDETDSGLDIDALRIVAEGVNQLMNPTMGLVMVTHYQRLLNYIQPHFVHVLAGGRIIRSGDKSLALKLEEQGYDWLLEETAAAAV
jgi:Fe-S cluster assembly ATP-binding protein